MNLRLILLMLFVAMSGLYGWAEWDGALARAERNELRDMVRHLNDEASTAKAKYRELELVAKTLRQNVLDARKEAPPEPPAKEGQLPNTFMAPIGKECMIFLDGKQITLEEMVKLDRGSTVLESFSSSGEPAELGVITIRTARKAKP